jgi:arylsulfatase A-like enzyme
MPSTLELAGLDIPEYVEFRSLLPYAREASPAEQPYNSIYGAYMDRQRMVRAGGFKLIAYPLAGKLRLFDLEEDPDEVRDLSDMEEYRDQLKEMFDRLVRLQAETGDSLSLKYYFPTMTSSSQE